MIFLVPISSYAQRACKSASNPPAKTPAPQFKVFIVDNLPFAPQAELRAHLMHHHEPSTLLIPLVLAQGIVMQIFFIAA
jgi:hypothetical protein